MLTDLLKMILGRRDMRPEYGGVARRHRSVCQRVIEVYRPDCLKQG